MKTYREVKVRTRKFKGYCEQCKREICGCKAYQYVDENNAAITNNNPYLCKECYEKKYKVHIKDDIEKYKSRLIETLQQVQSNQKIETIRIDKIIEFIVNSD